MEPSTKPYVQLVVDGIETVIHDADGLYDADQYDRYATFEQARDAALCCIEYALEEEGDLGPADRMALESTYRRLESALTIEDLGGQADLIGFATSPAAAA